MGAQQHADTNVVEDAESHALPDAELSVSWTLVDQIVLDSSLVAHCEKGSLSNSESVIDLQPDNEIAPGCVALGRSKYNPSPPPYAFSLPK